MKEEAIINRHIGTKLDEARRAAGYTRRDLAKKIGVSGQQWSKYEKGTNQISIGKLLKVGEALSLSIDYFVGDLKPTKLDEKLSKDRMLCLDISDNFMRIKDKGYRRMLGDVIKLLAEEHK